MAGQQATVAMNGLIYIKTAGSRLLKGMLGVTKFSRKEVKKLVRRRLEEGSFSVLMLTLKSN